MATELLSEGQAGSLQNPQIRLLRWMPAYRGCETRLADRSPKVPSDRCTPTTHYHEQLFPPLNVDKSRAMEPLGLVVWRESGVHLRIRNACRVGSANVRCVCNPDSGEPSQPLPAINGVLSTYGTLPPIPGDKSAYHHRSARPSINGLVELPPYCRMSG